MVSITELKGLLQIIANTPLSSFADGDPNQAYTCFQNKAKEGLELLDAIDDHVSVLEKNISDAHHELMQMESMDKIGQVFEALGYAENGLII